MWVLPVQPPGFHWSQCDRVVIESSSVPAVGLIYLVPLLLLLSIRSLDVNFSYVMAKSPTVFGV